MPNDPEKQALREALDEDELELHYQAIHDATTGQVISAEALMRWPGSRDGIGVEELAAAAERSEDLFRLQDWSIARACRDAHEWHTSGWSSIRVNVNISPRQLREDEVAGYFDRVIEESGIDGGLLNVEITERSFIAEPKKIVGRLRELTDRGIELWLDDFGSGHSSILHLLYFPVAGIKLPSVYVDGIGVKRRSETIICSLIDLGHQLGLKVVAEGVETEEQLTFLREAECDQVQGFVLSRPTSSERLPEILESFRGKSSAVRGLIHS